MVEVFDPLETQPDPLLRLDQIKTIKADFSDRLLAVYQRTAFDLKAAGWSIHQIGDELDVSVALVRKMIADHARNTRQVSPLWSRRDMTGAIDIRALVRLADANHPAGAATSRPTA